jgi:hypothetical protein
MPEKGQPFGGAPRNQRCLLGSARRTVSSCATLESRFGPGEAQGSKKLRNARSKQRCRFEEPYDTELLIVSGFA